MSDPLLSRRTLLLGTAGGAVALAGCGAPAPSTPAPGASSPAAPSAGARPSSSATTARPTATPRTPSPTPRPPDPAEVGANELGVVPVMMYHRLTPAPGEYDMTPGGFRNQVRRLLRSKYRPVDARDFARGRIDVPAGTTPVVLTFDDSSPGQFALTKDGRIDPESAAGILVAECAEVPGAEPRATFYLNREPFGLESEREQRRALRALLEQGFAIGNHSLDHANLATLSATGVAEQLVRLQQLVTRLVPDAEVATLALPFGVSPRRRRLAERGSWHGTSYRFDLTLLVGAGPSPSPYDEDFAPHAVPRIRGTSWHGGRDPLTGNYWLDYLQARPEERYVSAGNPGHVTVPKRLRGQVADRYRERLITY